MATAPEMGEGLIRTHDLLKHLIEDVHRSFEVLNNDKSSQYLRRVAVRNVFSFSEGVVQILKHEIKSDVRNQRFSYQLTIKDTEVLFEQKVRLEGKVQFFIPIEENIKKTFALAAKVWGLSSFKLDTNSSNYKCFIRCKHSRNRLTHPRTFYDINLSDSEISDFACSFIWIKSEFVRIMQLRMAVFSKDLPEEILAKLSNLGL